MSYTLVQRMIDPNRMISGFRLMLAVILGARVIALFGPHVTPDYGTTAISVLFEHHVHPFLLEMAKALDPALTHQI